MLAKAYKRGSMMPEKLTDRARLYLNCVADWKAPYEVSALLGDSPPESINSVKRMLGRLGARGLVQWSSANNTYRVTDEGRSALGQ